MHQQMGQFRPYFRDKGPELNLDLATPEGYDLPASQGAVAPVDGAVARGRLQGLLRRPLRWVPQEAGVRQGGHRYNHTPEVK